MAQADIETLEAGGCAQATGAVAGSRGTTSRAEGLSRGVPESIKMVADIWCNCRAHRASTSSQTVFDTIDIILYNIKLYFILI